MRHQGFTRLRGGLAAALLGVSAQAAIANDGVHLEIKVLSNRADLDSGGVAFTPAQWSQLQAAFADGVCDCAQPGVGQRTTVAWLGFADGRRGRPPGNAPDSRPVGRWHGER